MKKIILSTLVLFISLVSLAQNVSISDAKFKAYLVANTAINTNGDSEIQVSEASAFSGAIKCNLKDIYSVSGIEAFTSLTELQLFQNKIFGMDLSKNTALEILECGNNDLVNLNLSKNTALTKLSCSENDITTLDLSKNTALTELSCSYNKFTTLDLSNNPLLTKVISGQGKISTIDLSNLTVLKTLFIHDNEITALDLSTNRSLEEATCSKNLLEEVNIANGNNTGITSLSFTDNATLECIQVDNPAYSDTASNWNKDATSSYSLDCSTTIISYVNHAATGNNDGTSWADAYTDLREAFVNAIEGNEIWAAKGTYIRQNTTDRNSVFGWNKDNVKVYGGFDGTETMLSERDWRANKTIMSGDIGTAGDKSDNCYTVFVGPIGSSADRISYGLLDGFVIQDGNSNVAGSDLTSRGAGFNLQGYVSEMKIKNCVFTNNTAVQGGGIYGIASTVNSTLTIDACEFYGNDARFGSGALFVTNGADLTLNMSNSLLHNNETKDMGTLGDGGSGVIYVQGQGHKNINANISNTTITNNINNAGGHKGSLLFYRHSQATGSKIMTLNNCIIWGNEGDVHSIIKNTTGTDFNSLAVNNTLLQYKIAANILNVAKTNIIIESPMFTDSTNNVFTLKVGSPAIDAGTQSGLSISTKDIGGTDRIIGSEIDLGCYEYNPKASIRRVKTATVSLYPNPTSGILNIKSDKNITNVSVLNLAGQKVLESNNKSIDVSNLPTGMYILQTEGTEGLGTARFIKQ